MENRAANKRQKYDDDDEYGSGSETMISDLPESVLLRILCFLSQKKAGQTSVLSKSWRHLGPTRPVIELRKFCGYDDLRYCENCFNGNEESFISVVDNTFQRYHDRNIFPQEVDLQMLGVDSQSISVLEKWIPIFINPDNPAVTTFRLSFYVGPYSNLPSVVFKAEYLRELCLEWCRVNENIPMDDVVLRNLQILSLSSVEISDEALKKVISGCPLLQRLVLSECPGLQTIIINGNKNQCLNCLEIYCLHAGRTSIAINAPTLESIRIEGGLSNWYPKNINYFPHLKSLFLSYVTMSAELLFHNFSNNFPCLQELTVDDCRGFEEIELSSCSIKRLIIHESVEKLAIDVPNILYFEFSSYSLPTTFSLTTTSGREWKSHLDLSDYVYGHGNDDVLQRIPKLFEMVKELRQSQISLTLFEFQYFEIKQWDFNDYPVVVKHLALGFENLCPDSYIQLLNALFRIIRPIYTNAMSAPSKDYKKISEFLWKTLIHDRGETEHGWEQYLEEVSIEASDEKGKVWHHVEGTCFPEWSKNQTIRFRLKWRD